MISPNGANQASGRLADYLEMHKDPLMNDWLKQARADAVVLSDSLSRIELIDHVPMIFDAIVEVIRDRCGKTTSDVQDITARHTIIRWAQHYDLRAVLREVSLLRAALIRQMLAFDEQAGDLDSDSRLFTATTIHRILDDIVMDATETFLELKNRGDGDEI